MKRHNLMKKTFDKVFQSNIAVRYYISFNVKRFNLVETFDKNTIGDGGSTAL